MNRPKYTVKWPKYIPFAIRDFYIFAGVVESMKDYECVFLARRLFALYIQKQYSRIWAQTIWLLANAKLYILRNRRIKRKATDMNSY